jgi:hypothetical protein
VKKQVRETSAGRSIEAFVVLKKGREVAVVQVFHGQGTTRVDVFEKSLTYQGSAGGYGYDRFTAALDGAIIDGIKLYDHCRSDKACAAMLAQQPPRREGDQGAVNAYFKRLAKKGMTVTNWSAEADRWTSCFFVSGLDRLTAMGYTVIRAI